MPAKASTVAVRPQRPIKPIKLCNTILFLGFEVLNKLASGSEYVMPKTPNAKTPFPSLTKGMVSNAKTPISKLNQTKTELILSSCVSTYLP